MVRRLLDPVLPRQNHPQVEMRLHGCRIDVKSLCEETGRLRQLSLAVEGQPFLQSSLDLRRIHGWAAAVGRN